jgi:hypothetical protein
MVCLKSHRGFHLARSFAQVGQGRSCQAKESGLQPVDFGEPQRFSPRSDMFRLVFDDCISNFSEEHAKKAQDELGGHQEPDGVI